MPLIVVSFSAPGPRTLLPIFVVDSQSSLMLGKVRLVVLIGMSLIDKISGVVEELIEVWL